MFHNDKYYILFWLKTLKNFIKEFKINIYYAVLDNIINDMSESFEENNL
jgi:hypothetical protein